MLICLRKGPECAELGEELRNGLDPWVLKRTRVEHTNIRALQTPQVEAGPSELPEWSVVFVTEIRGHFRLDGLPGWVYNPVAEKGYFQVNIWSSFGDKTSLIKCLH